MTHVKRKKRQLSSMLNWLQLLDLPESELARYPVESLNHACAAGLPGSEGWDAHATERTIGDMAQHVAFETRRHAYRFQQTPQEYENSEAIFRLLYLANVLQQDCGVGYSKDLIGRRGDDFPHNVDTLFLRGLLRGRGGSCASLPVLYLAVGRRLGYPLRLVAAHCHWFLRWDDPATGERINMECSNAGGFGGFPDEHYLSWPTAVTPEQARMARYLVSMSPRQELAAFLQHRADCWMDAGRYGPGLQAFAYSLSLDPENL
jgi:regulator of sirC expression with transglutaminase-like and TPR domain